MLHHAARIATALTNTTAVKLHDLRLSRPVSAATINQNGALTCRAERVGQDTTLSQVIRLVRDAAATKAPLAKTADKVSGIFVPAVTCIALLTFVIWLLLGQTFTVIFDHGTDEETRAMGMSAVVEYSDPEETDYYCSLTLRFIEASEIL